MRLRAKAVVSTGLVALALPALATGHPARPTSRDQPLRDGCQRDQVQEILVNTPEWVYVNRDPTIRVAEGISHVPAPSPTDNPGTHAWYDFTANLVPDPAYRYLVAGSPSAHTNNFGPEGEAHGRLHYEWETGTLPPFAWPSDGDRTKIWGSWIWDCGHFGDSSHITGESTEFHPLNAIAVERRNSYRARPGEAETDAFISTGGTYAHATEECARRLRALPNHTYQGFFTCARHHANQRQPLLRSYSFFVPAPRRPAGATGLVLRTVSQARSGHTRERVVRRAGGFEVTVWPRGHVVRYGKEFYARWTGATARSTRLRVTFDDLLVKRADPSGTSPEDTRAGQWNLYAGLNGYWKLVNDWAPGLISVPSGTRFHLGRTVTVNVPAGSGVQLLVMGRECDSPSGRVLFGHFVPAVHPCPLNPGATEINGHPEDDPGAIFDRYPSAGAALGTHTSRSAPSVFFPGTGSITFKDGRQGADDYELTYTVRRG